MISLNSEADNNNKCKIARLAGADHLENRISSNNSRPLINRPPRTIAFEHWAKCSRVPYLPLPMKGLIIPLHRITSNFDSPVSPVAASKNKINKQTTPATKTNLKNYLFAKWHNSSMISECTIRFRFRFYYPVLLLFYSLLGIYQASFRLEKFGGKLLWF